MTEWLNWTELKFREVNSREGTQLHPSIENWIKDLMRMNLLIWTRPSFTLSQSLSSGSFHRPLILLHERADRLKTTIRKLIDLITWTTALSKSMKLWDMPSRATQDGWVLVESSDKIWSAGEGNGKPLQYSCLENAMNRMKRQKVTTLNDKLPRSVGAQ